MDSVEMLWGMAKATNPSDDVTGHRPLQMISQIFVDMSHSKYFQHVHCSSRLYSISLLNNLFLKHHATLHRSNHPESPSILVLILVAFCRSSARKSKFGLGRSPTWRSMRHAVWMAIDGYSLPFCFCRSRANDHFCPICVFSFCHASKWKEAVSWSLIIMIYEDHLDSS